MSAWRKRTHETGCRVAVVRCPDEPRLVGKTATVLGWEVAMVRIKLDSGPAWPFPSGEALVYLTEIEALP